NRSCDKKGEPQDIPDKQSFVCATCKRPLLKLATKPAVHKPAPTWSLERATTWASQPAQYAVPKANLKTFERPGAAAPSPTTDLPCGTVTVRVFSRSASAPANRQMVVLVCHGRQVYPARTSGSRSGVKAFAFVVPIGTKLVREFL